MTIEGNKAKELFKYESGGHRVQMPSPTDKRGRIHTSTITVAVLDIPHNIEQSLNQRELDITTTRGTGSGGQNKNKTETCVVIKHLPTGIMVRCENERSQEQNKRYAMTLLLDKLNKQAKEQQQNSINNTRKNQVGSGMRGDKIRTIRYQDGIVTNELNGKKIRLKDYLRGNWKGLF